MKMLRLIAALTLVAGIAAPDALADGRNKPKSSLAGKPAKKAAAPKPKAEAAPVIEREVIIETVAAPTKGPIYVTSLDGIGTGGVGYDITGDTGRSSSRIYFVPR